MENLLLASITQSARTIVQTTISQNTSAGAAQSTISQNAPADTVKTAADKPIDKEQALKMLNDFLNKATNKDNSYPQVYIITTPLKEREFFTNMNNPYSYLDYNGKPNIIANAITSTVVPYFIIDKLVELDTRCNLLGYETSATMFKDGNIGDPLIYTSTLPQSMLQAFNKGRSRYDYANIYAGHLVPTAMMGDGLYDSIDKIPPKARPLMAGFALYGILDPRVPLLWDNGNQYSIMKYESAGLNTSDGVIAAFVLIELFLRRKKIKYLYDTFTGKNPVKPKEDTVTGGSWMQGNTGFTGIMWKF